MPCGWGHVGGRAEVAEPLSKEYTHLPLTRTVWGATPPIRVQMLSAPVGELQAAMHAVGLVSPRLASRGWARYRVCGGSGGAPLGLILARGSYLMA